MSVFPGQDHNDRNERIKKKLIEVEKLLTEFQTTLKNNPNTQSSVISDFPKKLDQAVISRVYQPFHMNVFDQAHELDAWNKLQSAIQEKISTDSPNSATSVIDLVNTQFFEIIRDSVKHHLSKEGFLQFHSFLETVAEAINKSPILNQLLEKDGETRKLRTITTPFSEINNWITTIQTFVENIAAETFRTLVNYSDDYHHTKGGIRTFFYALPEKQQVDILKSFESLLIEHLKETPSLNVTEKFGIQGLDGESIIIIIHNQTTKKISLQYGRPQKEGAASNFHTRTQGETDLTPYNKKKEDLALLQVMLEHSHVITGNAQLSPLQTICAKLLAIVEKQAKPEQILPGIPSITNEAQTPTSRFSRNTAKVETAIEISNANSNALTPQQPIDAHYITLSGGASPDSTYSLSLNLNLEKGQLLARFIKTSRFSGGIMDDSTISESRGISISLDVKSKFIRIDIGKQDQLAAYDPFSGSVSGVESTEIRTFFIDLHRGAVFTSTPNNETNTQPVFLLCIVDQHGNLSYDQNEIDRMQPHFPHHSRLTFSNQSREICTPSQSSELQTQAEIETLAGDLNYVCQALRIWNDFILADGRGCVVDRRMSCVSEINDLRKIFSSLDLSRISQIHLPDTQKNRGGYRLYYLTHPHETRQYHNFAHFTTKHLAPDLSTKTIEYSNASRLTLFIPRDFLSDIRNAVNEIDKLYPSDGRWRNDTKKGNVIQTLKNKLAITDCKNEDILNSIKEARNGIGYGKLDGALKQLQEGVEKNKTVDLISKIQKHFADSQGAVASFSKKLF